MSNVQKTYFFGDLCHIVRGENWDNLTSKMNNRKTNEINEPLSFQLQDGRAVTCYIQSTRWGDDSYPFSNFDSNELTKVLYQPEYIHVETGTIGLVCLNDLVGSDDELATIIRSVKENNWGALFLPMTLIPLFCMLMMKTLKKNMIVLIAMVLDWAIMTMKTKMM